MDNRFFPLPFTYDPQLLEADLQKCLGENWSGHFHSEDFSGTWESISLRSVSGRADDIRSHPDASKYRDTPLLETCTYFRSIIDAFQCEKESIRLLNLAPGSVIHEHTDPGGGYADGLLRLHIPVRTNDRILFLVDQHPLKMLPGECWYADFSLPHSVRNDGDTGRIHLIIDGVRNDWTDQLFAEAGYDFEAEKRARQRPAAERMQVIEELKRQGTPTALQLAETMQRELDEELSK